MLFGFLIEKFLQSIYWKSRLFQKEIHGGKKVKRNTHSNFQIASFNKISLSDLQPEPNHILKKKEKKKKTFSIETSGSVCFGLKFNVIL